jgi:hypothetical protein
MATFTTDNTARTPFGKNAYLRSTQDVKTASYTFAASGIPEVVVDGNVQKVLQPGTVLAKITSGPDTGKVGVFQATGTDEVQRLTKAGTVSGGTFTLTVLGATTDPIAYDANAAAIQAAIRAAIAADPDVSDAYKAIGDGITVVGGPLSGATPVDITYNGEVGADVAQVTADTTLLTGAGAGITPSTTTPGAAGATDGRQTTANIVGICDTFLPWQLLERDVEVAAVYEATVVQAWCIEYNASGSPVALGDTTRDAMIALATTKNISYK